MMIHFDTNFFFSNGIYFLYIFSILMTEAYVALPNALKYYGEVRNGIVTKYIADIPFNFILQVKTTNTTTASSFKRKIHQWIDGMPKGDKIHANWVVSISVFNIFII